MDLSKIPGSSSPAASTPQPVPPPEFAAEITPRRSDRVGDPGSGADAYFAIAIGALMLLLYPRLLQFVSHKLFGTAFAPFLMPDGSEVSYLSQRVFVSDLAITAFAMALLLEGALQLLGGQRRSSYYAAAGIVGVATALNAYVLISQFSGGLPLVSALATIFGAYSTMALYNRAKS